MVELDDSIAGAVCAEPAISSLKSKAGKDVEIVVCGSGGELFLNHPSITAVIAVPETDAGEDQLYLRLKGPEAANAMSIHLVDWYAKQMGVNVENKCPRIYLESVDFVTMQKFHAGSDKSRRIAIAPGSDVSIKLWGHDKWKRLCKRIEETFDADIIQIGCDGDVFVGFGEDLTGKLSPRQGAALIKTCDLLVSVDNGFVQIAGAVETPCVALFGPIEPASRIYEESCKAVIASEDECNGCMHVERNSGSDAECIAGSNECMANISVSQVLDRVAEFCETAEEIILPE
ncbi:MAG TPA: hypothetical protein ENH94_03785 [Phycisphaerales bacterium]|nr:hypothetical protein [Phycisphaerales bacterium]